MKRSTRDLFKRLDDQKKARPVLEPLPRWYPERPSNFQKGTIGHFADQMAMPVDILIKQLADAGIANVTPEHKFHQKHQEVLLQRLRVLHSDKAPTAQKLYQKEEVESDHVLLVQDINLELLSYLSKNPEAIYQLGSRKFEELVARLFEDRGYRASLTKSTRDGGYDVLAVLKDSFTSFVVLAECKRYRQDRRVGVEIVRGLYGVTEANRANQGLIITSSFFTHDAHEEQLRLGNRIGLKDYNNLVEWLSPYAS